MTTFDLKTKDVKILDFLRWNSYVSKIHKILYIATPKVACTSLKWWFANLEGYSQALRETTGSTESDPELVIHDLFYKVAPDVTGLAPEALTEPLLSDEYFRFAVVRNPYKRIFSAWQSKLLLREPLQSGPYINCDFFQLPITSHHDIARAFEGFLEYLAANEATDYKDVHWTPQVTLLRPDLITYSELAQIENVQKLRQALVERIGPNSLDPFATRPSNESLIPYLPEFITERSAELIRTLYAEDFNAFGYDLQRPAAKDEFSTSQLLVALQAINLIRGRHQRFGEIRTELTERSEKLAKLTHNLDEYNQHISNLEIALADREGQIANLNQIVTERDQHISTLDLTLADREGQITNITSSRSWKLTAPLRYAKSIFGPASQHPKFAHLYQTLRNVYLTKSPERAEFNPEFYLANNPDVATAGIDPFEHYTASGKREGRLGRMPTLNILGRLDSLDPKRETVLIVGHEGTRTGAPILSYSLVRDLSKRYNVVALFLGPGPILEACHAAGAVVLGLSQQTYLSVNSTVPEQIIKPIIDVVSIKFAIVNSVESRGVLATLAKFYIPTITLIHEFAIYVHSRGGIRESALWSGQTVFSTHITRDNAYANEIHDLVERNFPIIPQGRCVLPTDSSAVAQDIDAKRIRRAMRPPGFPENGLVLLGIGSVVMRKGVDLFIESATQICKHAPDLPCRFVWIGKGYSPETDAAYSMFLADQIDRAGLNGKICFIDEVSDLATAYSEANIFLLTSRLDPLPNVAIDALSEGLPVICFDKTTGIADVLRAHELGDYCVADYLDAQDLAQKALALAQSKELRERVGEKAVEISTQVFSMPHYVTQLEQLAKHEIERAKQEREDVDTIVQSALFQPNYYLPPYLPHLARSKEIAARTYVRTWASSIDLRKPFPGFHPGIYLEQHGVTRQYADPFADYIRSGQPKGPWNFGLITPTNPALPIPSSLRIGLHIHVYYLELFSEIIERLKLNQVSLDLLISVTNEEAKKTISAQLKDYKCGQIDIRVVPNLGRDIGPFLTEFGNKIRKEYDLIGHLHTKKTKHNEQVGRQWYGFIPGKPAWGQ